MSDYSEFDLTIVSGSRMAINGKGIQGPKGADGSIPDTFNVKAQPYGAKGDGTTDDYAAVMAAINAAYANGGGTVFFPVGTYRINSQIVMPNTGTGGGIYSQPPITLMGAGARVQPALADSPSDSNGGVVLDLRSTATDGKIVTYGQGRLSIRNLLITDLGTSSNVFLRTTNTQLVIDDTVFQGNPTKSGATCDQDAIVLGGLLSLPDNTPNGLFQGYGTKITNVGFSSIRRGILFQAGANAVVVDSCYWNVKCGADSTAAAIEFNAGADQSRANVITNCLFEMLNYAYGIKVNTGSTSFNTIHGCSFWDSSDATLLSHVYVASGTGGISILQCYMDGSLTKKVTGGGGYLTLLGTTLTGSWAFGGGNGGLSAKPISAASDTDTLFGVYRSQDGADPNPGAASFTVLQNGHAALNATTTGTAPLITISNTKNSNGTLTVGEQAIIRSAGTLDLYPGSGTGDFIRVMRGGIRLLFSSTASRPSASNGVGGLTYYDSTTNRPMWAGNNVWHDFTQLRTFTTAGRPAANATDWGAGSCYFDTTLNKPVWSDGTNWRDATGTIV